MDKWLFYFFLGAVLSLFLPIVPAIFHIVLLLALLFVLIIRKRSFVYTGFLFGCTWILYQGICYQNDLTQLFSLNNKIVSDSFFLKAHIIKGHVVSLITESNSNISSSSAAAYTSSNADSELPINDLRFNFKVSHLDYLPLSKPIKIRLRWQQAPFKLQQGNVAQLSVKLKPSHGLANSGGFNYQVWLRAKNIVATGYVRNTKESTLVNKIEQADSSFRQQQYSKIKSLLADTPLSSFVIALALGDRSAISTKQWQVLTATGTQHLIAISGLHLGLIASVIFWLVSKIIHYLPLKFLKNSNITQFNHRYVAIVVSLLFTLFYAALSGFALPTIRALFMLLFYWLLRAFSINIPLYRWILLVIFAVLLTEPMGLLSASFWLTFYAVIVIFLVLWRAYAVQQQQLVKAGYFNAVIKFLKSLFIIQLGLTIFLIPISLIIFKQFSALAFLANIVAVPLMSLTAIPLSLAGVLVLPLSEQLAKILFELSAFFLTWLWYWLDLLAQQPWALIQVSSTQIVFISLILLIFAAKYFLQLPRRYSLYLIPVLLVLLVNQYKNSAQPWQLTVLDVGHGLAVVINRDNRAILYDTGAKYPSGFTMGEAVILPFLQQKNIQHLDHLVISHNDNDHLGSLAVLQRNLDIKNLIYNDQQVNVNGTYCLQGQHFTWQGLTIEQLWPKSLVFDKNDHSCVIKISDGYHKVLLTGDISKKVEQQLIDQKIDLTADTLIVPHHGSKSSSSEAFIQAVSPQRAIFSNGYLNRWKMPTPEVLRRYHKQGIITYTTASNGMIMLSTTANKTAIKTFRQDLFPYWFAN
jgi:competence protein ComEC